MIISEQNGIDFPINPSPHH